MSLFEIVIPSIALIGGVAFLVNAQRVTARRRKAREELRKAKAEAASASSAQTASLRGMVYFPAEEIATGLRPSKQAYGRSIIAPQRLFRGAAAERHGFKQH